MIGPSGDAAGRSARGLGRARARNLLGFFLATAWYVLRREGVGVAQVWTQVRAAPAGWLVAAILLPIGNWVCMCGCFWVLMRREAVEASPSAPHPLTGWRMLPILGLTWLLNYLPLRPGLFGRLAYHRVVNGIPLSASVRAVVMNLIAGVASIALGAIGVAITALVAAPESGLWLIAAGLPSALMLAVSRCTTGPGRTLVLAIAIRGADLLVWAARYLVVFKLIGEPIPLPAGLAIAAASQAMSVIPISGNGLGVREWTVGLTISVLPSALLAGRLGTEIGVTADLVNRAAELLVALPVGVVSGVLILRRLRAVPNAREELSRRSDGELPFV
jgi:uncharacterized membrane protein YbhN (UPF0104 family)